MLSVWLGPPLVSVNIDADEALPQLTLNTSDGLLLNVLLPKNVLEPVVAKLPVLMLPPPPNDDVATALLIPWKSPTHAYPCCKDAVNVELVASIPPSALIINLPVDPDTIFKSNSALPPSNDIPFPAPPCEFWNMIVLPDTLFINLISLVPPGPAGGSVIN